ncbi:hypothetical protein [Nocardioides convexus]|uniref:hypothetical protein n=1 Tax=Nocardioides convexus TaxID=2712224 RepID=UPI002418487E|nr:hypothetical protein [Nocardioides convexus]
MLELLAGRYPSDEFAESAPPGHLGPGDRADQRPARCPAARGHQRRHDSRPRSLRRVPRRLGRRAPGR